MKFVMTLSTVSLLGIISILHVYWAYGGRWGTHAVIPSRAGSINLLLFLVGRVHYLWLCFFLLCVSFFWFKEVL